MTGTEEVRLELDGEQVSVPAGTSLAAVLLILGRPAWRVTRRRGRPRGAFCGIGACFDCLLEVDGVPEQRACLIAARPGMRVRTQDVAQVPG